MAEPTEADRAAAFEPPGGAAKRRFLNLFPYAALALLALGALAVVAGALLPLAGIDGIAVALTMGGGLVALGLAMSFGWGVDRIELLRPPVAGDRRHSDIRNWQVLKVLAILLNLLMVVAAVALLAVLVGRAGLIGAIDQATMARIANFLIAGIAVVVTATFVQALRNDLDLDRSMATASMHVVAVMLALAAAAYGMLLEPLSGPDVAAQDGPLLGLLATTLLAFDLFVTRSIPNAYHLLAGDRRRYKGPSYFSEGKSVLVPTLAALGLLLLGFLILLIIESGTRKAFDLSLGDPLVPIVIVVVGSAMIASLIFARRLAKQEDKPEFYKPVRTVEEERKRTMMAVSAGLALMAGIFTGLVFSGNGGALANTRWVDVLGIGLLVSLGPYGFYIAYEHRRTRGLEDRFPDFLRDIAASHKGGLTLHGSVTIAAKGDYGALTPFVQKMAAQMSWNVPFGESLRWFADQVRTPIIRRAVYLILEADHSGGSTADVLYAASRDARELKRLEEDRKISMGLYTLVIYITFGVFLVVAAVMYNQFVPELINASQASSIEGSAALGINEAASLGEYRAFYYLAALVQAAGGGIVAGMMSTGRATLGLQHSFLMVAISVATFTVVLP